MTDLQRQLRAIREEQKITRFALATQSGHSENQIYRWETGKTSITLKAYIDLLECMGWGLELQCRPR